MNPSPQRLFCVVPAFRAAGTIVNLVRQALEYADEVVVVDAGCPEHSGSVAEEAFRGVDSVRVIRSDRNGGTGAAVKAGIARCLDLGADLIVTVDNDGPMDPSFISISRKLLEEDGSLVCVKGNRFFGASVIPRKSRSRLLGNVVLSLLTKFASGYWNVVDPTNGYLALNARVLALLPWRSFADSSFFATSVLCELGLRRLPLIELEMPAVSSGARTLSWPRVRWDYPLRLVRLVARRMLVQYFIFDLNLGSIYLSLGSLLLLAGGGWGAYQWIASNLTHEPRSTGTVMLAVLPFLMGFQLVLNAIMFDVEISQRLSREMLVNPRRRSPGNGQSRT